MILRNRFITFWIAILIVVFAGCTKTPKTTKTSILDRVAVTGASVTAGHGLSTPPIKGDLGAYPVNMKHIMEGIITAPHDDVEYFGELMFFLNPRAHAKKFVKEINDYEPTLLIAVDFLFWFGHGTPPQDVNVATYRMKKMHFALDLLDQLNCKIIVGNLPNIQSAIGKILSKRQVPTPELLVQLNERIEEWGRSKSNVTVIDANRLWDLVINDKEVTVFGSTWPAGSRDVLLQQDMLHLTLEGTVAASLLAAEAIAVEGLETNPKIIMKRAAAAARKDQ